MHGAKLDRQYPHAQEVFQKDDRSSRWHLYVENESPVGRLGRDEIYFENDKKYECSDLKSPIRVGCWDWL